MTTSFYDVIVIGTELAPLSCAALLARRGFRVLVLGHDDVPPSYRIEGYTLPRAPFTCLSSRAPSVRRVLSELALGQRLRRMGTPLEPVFQAVLPGHRFDISSDPRTLERELEREFPEVKRPVEDFHRRVATYAERFDRVVERDLTWPPESFLDKRELARAMAALPYDRRGVGRDPLAELPDEHPFRLAVHAPIRFADHSDPDHLTALRLMRLYASWYCGALHIQGGFGTIRELLADRIRTGSGDIRAAERVDQLLVRGHATHGVRVAVSGEEIGASYVIAGIDAHELLHLLPDRGPLDELFERLGEPQPRYFRYTLNLVVDRKVVPATIDRDVFAVRQSNAPLLGDNLLHLQKIELGDPKACLLSVEAVLSRRGLEDIDGYLEGMRERLLKAIADVIPFIERHLILVDSPHDGRPPRRMDEGRNLTPDDPWTRGPRTMPIMHAYPVTSTLGVCALPLRLPLKQLLLCSSQVVPGLGMEGSMLAAWSAARMVTRRDRGHRWLRRGLWNKIEV